MAARKKVGSWTENRTQQPVSVSLENNKPAKCSAHQQSSAQKPNDESKWRRFRNGITHEAKWKAAAVAKYPQRLKLHPHTRSMAFMLNHCSEKWEQNHHNFLCYVSCRFFLTLMCRRLLFLLSSVRLPLNWFGECVCVCLCVYLVAAAAVAVVVCLSCAFIWQFFTIHLGWHTNAFNSHTETLRLFFIYIFDLIYLLQSLSLCLFTRLDFRVDNFWLSRTMSHVHHIRKNCHQFLHSIFAHFEWQWTTIVYRSIELIGILH